MESPYDVLGIDTDAEREAVDRAYRRRVKETHPDHGGTLREFQLVRTAYQAITSDRRSEDFEAEREKATEQYQQMDARVEYLDYEVLDDYGWSLDDESLFEKAADADLDPADYGRFLARPDETLLQAAENRGFTWPYSCRGGACANCAVAVVEGELSIPVNHVLPSELVERGIRLSCVGAPITDDLQVVYNVKHLPDLDDLQLPPGPFREGSLDD